VTGEAVAGASVPPQRADAERFAGTTAGPALDRLAELARRLAGASSAQIWLIDGARVVGSAGAAPAVSVPVHHDDVAAYLEVPLVTPPGEAVGVLCVFDSRPRPFDDADVELLTQLAQSVVAELELAALAREYQTSLTRWGLAIDAAGVGTFDWDLRTGQLTWDDRMLTMFGYGREDFGRGLDDFTARVHPDDLSRVMSAVQTAIDTCGAFEAEYRVVRPDGSTRWVAARGRALGGEGGVAVRLLGAAHDTTDVREGESRVARVLESMSAGFCSLDREWRFTYVNGEAERVLGRSRDELLGGVIWTLFPHSVGSDFEKHYRAAVETGQQVTFEAYYPAPLDAWFEVRAWPGPDGLSVYFLDVSPRRAAQARADAAIRRSRLVADVTTGLSDTLDAEEAVARLAQLLVPDLADWCLVTLVDDEGRLRDVGRAHVDPELQPLVERYSALRLDALLRSSFLAQAMRTGQPAVVADDATTRICAVLSPGEAQELLVQLAPESAAILPMQARGRTVGLLSVFKGTGRGAYDAGEIATARDVAARAALALDNARLFQQQRRLAEQLQRSLLTPPPERDDMQVVVRYVPAAQAAQVGGDWYDAFLQPGGATVLVIGDVVGHDTAAAAAMGQVRGLLRGIAFTTEQGPAHVLTRLDAAIEGLQVGTNASAVVARLEQSPEDKAQGITHLRWSNAGHPPPMTVTPGGEISLLAGEEADLLLGIDPSSPRTESRIALARDATVLLYTDGLVERRGQSLDEGLERLRGALGELSALPLDELCDALLARLLPSSSDDDVAIVAVRLHRQDEPRPPEARREDVPWGVPAP
jgi:PAS domain S-box-containing protein